MRIAVIGYYGHLNAGDELLQAALTHVLSEHLLLFTSWYSPRILNEADLVIVGGGGQWPASAFFRHGDWFARRLTTPWMVLGISATHADDDVCERTRPLVDRAAYFHVRDDETRRLLGDHSSIVSGVDLFWWMPWDAGDPPAAERPRTAALALRDWTPEAWDPPALVDAVRGSLEVRPFPFHYGSLAGNPKSTVDDRAFLERLGLSGVPAVWSPRPAQTSDLTVAMRYHAIQVAVRSGRPAIGLDIDPKIGRFFAEHGIPELCVGLNEPAALEQAVARLSDDYPRYCEQFAAIRDRLAERAEADLSAFREALATVRPKARPGRARRALDALLGRVRS